MAVQDPVADGKVNESNEIFQGKEREIQRVEDLKNKEIFQATQTFENLQNALPTKIEIGDKTAPIDTGKKLLDRISSNRVAYEGCSQRLETAFFEHGEDFFPGIQLESIIQSPAEDKEGYMQKFAIIEACYGNMIHLVNPDDRRELADLLLPLAGKAKIKLKETKNDQTEETEKMSEEQLAFTKNPAFPVLTRLLDEGLITHVNFEEIKQFYIKNKNFSGFNISEHSETVQAHLDSVFNNGEENKKKNIAHFFEDFPEGDQEDMEFRPALKMIAENYMPIIGKKNPKNIQLDYFTAVEVSANIVLEKYQNIDILSVKYEDAMKFIKTGNKEERYEGLKMLIELAGEHEGQFASIEKGHRRTRIEQLLIASHKQGQQEVENRIEKAKLARKLGEDEGEDDNDEDQNMVDTEVETIPGGVKDIEVTEKGKSGPSQ